MSQATVLVAEDDPTLREALCETLELAGYQVESASDGKSASKLCSIICGHGGERCTDAPHGWTRAYDSSEKHIPIYPGSAYDCLRQYRKGGIGHA